MPTATAGVVFPFNTPLYTGGAVAFDVPGKWPFSLAGRPYMIDTADQNWKDTSIPMLKQLYDPNPTPSEASLNAEGLWRRAQDSWHEGAGQTYRDRDTTGSAYRFRSSKGLDVWTRFQMSLLPDTVQKKSAAGTNLALVSAGSRLYLVDGTALYYTTDMTSWTTVTGTPGVTITGLASDGFNVWIACGASGIYSTNTGTSAAASFVTGTTNGVLGYTKGRLLCAVANVVYNPTAAGTLPAATFTHPNTSFAWVGFTEGTSVIYGAGYAGDKSLIYRFQIKPDGSALDPPVVAGELPDGEIVRSIQGYLGKLLIGTDVGVRTADQAPNGDLIIGGLISLSASVRCFEPQDHFVWFGWTNYDTTSTGLGRLDAAVDGDPITGALAYSSDLMATTQGTVLSVVTFTSLRVFAVSGVGVYAQTTTKVASGTIDSGLVSYTLPDSKTLISLNLHTSTLPSGATVGMSLSTNEGSFGSLGSAASGTDNDFNPSQIAGEQFELRLTLNRATDTTVGPTVRRYTFKALAGAHDGPNEYLTVPVLLHNTVETLRGEPEHVDVPAEISNIKGLRKSRQVVTAQYYTDSYSVIVEDYELVRLRAMTDGRSGAWATPQGTMSIKLKRVN